MMNLTPDTGWCNSREGRTTLMDIRAGEDRREALTKRFCDIGVPSWTRSIPGNYGKPNSQLMLS
jgi:hypothetical protein